MTDEIQTYLDNGGAYEDLPLETRQEIEANNMKDTQLIKQEEKILPVQNEAERLIAMAIDKNVPVESLERLLAMRQQLKAERAKEQFVKAMAEFQGECPIIEKKKKVDFTPASGNRVKYNYAPLEVIVDQVKKILSKHGFSYMFDTETNGKMKVICKVTHKDGHMEVSKFDMEIDTSAKMNVSQKYGAALTYAKRYAFCSAFGISVRDEDNETTLGESQNTQNSSPSGSTALKNSFATYSASKGINKANASCYSCSAPSGRMHGTNCKA